MSVQHTPGPWVAVAYTVHDKVTRFDESGARIGDTPNRIVSVEYPYGDYYGQEANARLIAAAPELLESLHDLLTRPTDGASRQRARDIINKIKGNVIAFDEPSQSSGDA